MQSKSTRGVQQEDVWAAADKLLAEQLRPTIERVRLKLGRGSPNTVAPMLESWFASLGQRLGLKESKPEEGGMPPGVKSAMADVWTSAMAATRQIARQELVTSQVALDTEKQRLSEYATTLAAHEARLQDKQNSIDQTMLLAQGQIADLAARLSNAANESKISEQEIGNLRAQLETVQNDRDAARQLIQTKSEEFEAERRRLDERSASNERRLLKEVDLARQEAKQAKQSLGSLEKRHAALGDEIQAIQANEAKRSQAIQLQVAALRERLATANARTDELRRLCSEQAAQLKPSAASSKGRLTSKTKSQPRRKIDPKPKA